MSRDSSRTCEILQHRNWGLMSGNNEFCPDPKHSLSRALKGEQMGFLGLSIDTPIISLTTSEHNWGSSQPSPPAPPRDFAEVFFVLEIFHRRLAVTRRMSRLVRNYFPGNCFKSNLLGV